jgi:glycosyltransferase involved in cell wall biosynthesis
MVFLLLDTVNLRSAMRLCFIADARSPITRGWVGHFVARGDEVHIISSYPCEDEAIHGAAITVAPVAFASFAGRRAGKAMADKPSPQSALSGVKRRALAISSTVAQHTLLPLGLRRQVEHVRRLIAHISPDIVHAMRIPFEGIVAAQATPRDVPLVISVWGNDFTLWAAHNPLIARQTRQALKRADALHTDCRRDRRMAIEAWGFADNRPTAVLPAAGGVRTARFYAGAACAALRQRLNIDEAAPVIINPRGFRNYVRNDVFFAATARVLSQHPMATFLCVAMQGDARAERWVEQYSIAANIRLLPQVAHDEMGDLFRLASVAVSPSLYDGTPNTLLEAMACGCLPVAGDIESVREWIDDGVNGLLCDPTSSESLAAAMTRALDDAALRCAARARNLELIAERAAHERVMQQAEAWYAEIIRRKHQSMTVRAEG